MKLLSFLPRMIDHAALVSQMSFDRASILLLESFFSDFGPKQTSDSPPLQPELKVRMTVGSDAA